MNNSSEFNFDDLQGLLRYGHGNLTDTCFMLLNITDINAAKHWLSKAPVTSATETDKPPDTALQIAFSVEGLRKLGLNELVIKQFSDEFFTGMSGNEGRSRRIGDVGANAPEHWGWGGKAKQVPHILLLLYARENGLESWRKTVEGEQFSQAFQTQLQLPTLDIRQRDKDGKPIALEPFGFRDGISQPKIDWEGQQSTDPHDRDRYSNLLAVGEVVFGYPNEYGLYTARPLIDPRKDSFAVDLPNAEDNPKLKDFGRNGTYLVLRQLAQDVPGFWQFLDKETGSEPEKREQLAASMVGRDRSGAPLISELDENIPGVSNKDNRFTYDQDLGGTQCPIGAHIRRSNPRTGDLPPGGTGFISRLLNILGFGQKPDEDQVASTRFHRLMRRGRAYGPVLTPENAIEPDAPAAERGLQFICLAANILRQFEFVQDAWTMNSKFSSVQQESDPLLGNREPLASGDSTDQFNRPDSAGPVQKTCHLPQFITVRGGGYFFMPGLRTLSYIAALPLNGRNNPS